MIIYNERTTLARATRVVIHSVAAIWGVQAVQCTGAPKGITPEIDFRDVAIPILSNMFALLGSSMRVFL